LIDNFMKKIQSLDIQQRYMEGFSEYIDQR